MYSLRFVEDLGSGAFRVFHIEYYDNEKMTKERKEEVMKLFPNIILTERKYTNWDWNRFVPINRKASNSEILTELYNR